jgi:hypothetical protein
VVSEWATPRSVDDAHPDPGIVAVWEDKARLVEYLGVAGLDGAGSQFVSYDVIESVQTSSPRRPPVRR